MPLSFRREDALRSRALVAAMPYTIGASVDCDLCIPRLISPPTASDESAYAKLSSKRGEFVLSAVGDHALLVNGERIPFIPLRDGDTLTVELIDANSPREGTVPTPFRFHNFMPGAFVQPGVSLASAWCAHEGSQDDRFGPMRYLKESALNATTIASGTTLANDQLIKVSRPYRDMDHAQAQLALLAAISGSEHPGLVPFIDGGLFRQEDRVHSFLVTKYVAGQTAGELMQRAASATHGERARMLYGVVGAAKGLRHLHRRGILHRDVSPGNVIVRSDGEGFLIDYDQAVLMRQVSSSSDAIVGTPGFIAPEVVTEGSAAISAESDIYALVAVIYAMCTGSAPVDGENPLAAVSRSVRPPPRPSELGVRLTTTLEDLLMAGLSAKPNDRPHARDVIDTLERAVRRLLIESERS